VIASFTPRRRFVLIAGAGAVLVAATVLVTNLNVFGDSATVAIEDFGEAVAAFAAATACMYTASRAKGRLRTAWRLLALAATSWGLGEVAWTYYEVGLGVDVPFPSAADLGFLGAVPLAAAGILSFPSSGRSITNRSRAVMDGTLIALSLVFMAWAFGLSTLYTHAPLDDLGRLLAVAYPAADIALVTLLGLAVRKASGQLRVAILLLAAAYVSLFLADTAFAFLTLTGDYGVLGSAWDSAWIVGFFLFGLAAVWASGTAAAGAEEEDRVELWQLALPWLGVLAVISAVAWYTAHGSAGDVILGGLGSVIGVLFVVSQAMALNDSLQLLNTSRATEAKLAERTELLGEIFTRAPLGIARLSPALRFIEANPTLCELLATPMQALVGASIMNMLPPEDARGVSLRVEQLRTGRLDRVDIESKMRRGDGRELWVHRVVSTVRRADGEVEYFLVMFEDITAKHETAEAALANLASLERLSRLKSEFMSMVSHEFRTALTGIQGYSEVMTNEEVSADEVKEFAGDINADALRLNRMITEMLDLDRIESGRIQMHMEAVDLNKLICDAVDRARMSTDKHEIAVDLETRVGLIQGDRDRLTQVIANLLSNAVKYSPNGGMIVVTSRIHGGTVEVAVQDHGQGIPPEFAQRIFGRYERYEDGANKQVGTGLGLAIAQQIIQLHKGRIWVESKLGEGSTFRFAIPVASVSQVARA
jgi:PAS domain S-box-containing protein